MKEFTFINQLFEPDYIAFKFERLDWFREKEIKDHLFSLGFNIYDGLPPRGKATQTNLKNKFKIYFTKDTSDWDGSVFHFTGKNGKHFYTLLKEKSIGWIFFEDAILQRFDLCYIRQHKKSDKTSVVDFFFGCFKKIESTHRNVKVEKNKLGLIEKIGHRTSSRYMRIYEDIENKKFLKFEYELKKNASQKYHSLLVSEQFEKFEYRLCLDFITQFGKLLPLNYSYLDWLVYRLRPFRKVKKELIESGMKIDYLIDKGFSTLSERRNFWKLLQFLNFVKKLDYQTDSLGDISYRFFSFPVQDFLAYTNESNNHYQLKKVLEFLNQLQANSMIQHFAKDSYRSLVTIPNIKIFPGKQNRWIAEVWVAEELFYYTYPFLLPDLFQKKLTKPEFEVVFQVTRVLTSENLEKIFFIKKYFKNYPSTLSNSQKTKIKNYFIKIIEKLKEDKLIEDSYKILEKGSTRNVDKLTSKNINESFIVCERLDIKFP